MPIDCHCYDTNNGNSGRNHVSREHLIRREQLIVQPAFAATRLPGTTQADPAGTAYQPGVCNIGPAEIARRRLAGNVGLLVTVILLAVLVAIHAPPIARLFVALPAAGAASGYLQASLKFCAGFGSRGLFNFGPVGQTEQASDPHARARDRARARQIGGASIAIGVAIGVAAVLLPL